ncbi:MAG: hypothetical protein CMJ80_17705 [Planctomycetaceae bacterium]|nr:hypothetical protein [Planctomycetaceae bacterium]
MDPDRYQNGFLSPNRPSTNRRTNQMNQVNQACGLLFCFNEEEIIGETIAYYLSQGIDLVVFDNESTDDSLRIIDSFRNDGSAYAGQIRDVCSISTEGYEWRKILQFACAYMHKELSDYDWILLIDADGFYQSPVRGLTLLEFLNEASRHGFNMFDGALYAFYPTLQDHTSIENHRERLRYCQPFPNRPPVQQRIFRYQPDIDFYSDCAHRLYGSKLRECPLKFIYEHYVWLSFEHGVKKVFTNRRARYVDLPGGERYFSHHLHLLPIQKDFVRDHHDLWLYELRSLQISRRSFSIRMALKPLFEFIFAKRRRMFFYTKNVWDSLAYRSRIVRFDPRRALRRKLRGVFGPRTKKRPPTPNSPLFQAVNEETVAAQPIVLHRVPTRYHFLMTNFCNVRCNFCNQDFNPASKDQMRLSSFEKILSHIPSVTPCHFSFSGGGDPLLCRDLIEIIRHVDENRPEICTSLTTNGFLLKRHAADLARTSLDELWLAVHGATTETNNQILQTRTSEDVFGALPVLERELVRVGNTSMSKIFYMVVSQANIEELPALISRANEFGVGRVYAAFCRYYPWDQYRNHNGQRPKQEESLYYDQQRYNRVIERSHMVARSAGVEFGHDQMFGEKKKSRSCREPWERVLVDFDGTVYPCLGGEVWFKNKVQSGAINFGNLMNEHILNVVNSEGYIRARRSCNAFSGENVLKECQDCHQTLDLVGPDVKHAHMVRMPQITNQLPQE